MSISTQGRVIESEINYFDAMEQRPVFNAIDPSKTNLQFTSKKVGINDARYLAESPSLEKEGFTLVQHQSNVKDFTDSTALEQDYLPEISSMIKGLTGAKLVVSSPGPIYRNSAAQLAGKMVTAGAARFAHTDYTDESALHHFLPQHIDPDEAFQQFSRITVYQTWRAVSGAWQDVPLAIVDGRSVQLEDMVSADAILGEGYTGAHEQNSSFEFSLCLYNPDHRWHYYSQMQPDEVLVFKGFDFDPQQPSRLFHTAFNDLSVPAGTPPRESVEARAFAFFE